MGNCLKKRLPFKTLKTKHKTQKQKKKENFFPLVFFSVIFFNVEIECSFEKLKAIF